jgi:hypothetical protein
MFSLEVRCSWLLPPWQHLTRNHFCLRPNAAPANRVPQMTVAQVRPKTVVVHNLVERDDEPSALGQHHVEYLGATVIDPVGSDLLLPNPS